MPISGRALLILVPIAIAASASLSACRKAEPVTVVDTPEQHSHLQQQRAWAPHASRRWSRRP